MQHSGEVITCPNAFKGLTIKQAGFAKVLFSIRQSSVGAIADMHWGRENTGNYDKGKTPPLTVEELEEATT